VEQQVEQRWNNPVPLTPKKLDLSRFSTGTLSGTRVEQGGTTTVKHS
jgi:hypothetical protein